MKKLLNVLLVSFLMALGHTATSNAEMGFNVGLSGNNSAFYGEGTETLEGDATATATREAGAFTANYLSAFIELDTGSVVLGVDYVPSDIDTPTNTNLQNGRTDSKGQKTNTVKATFQDLITAYAMVRAPYGLYAKVGYSMVDIITKENLGTGGSYNDVDTEGYTAGFGWEKEMDGGVLFRVEAMAAAYDDVQATSTSASTKSVEVNDMMSATARISIAKSF